MTIESWLAVGLLAVSLGVLAVNRRTRRLEARLCLALRARGHWGPPPRPEDEPRKPQGAA